MTYMELIESNILTDRDLAWGRTLMALSDWRIDFHSTLPESSVEYQQMFEANKIQLITNFLQEEFGSHNSRVYLPVLSQEYVPRPRQVAIDWDEVISQAYTTGTVSFFVDNSLTNSVSVTNTVTSEMPQATYAQNSAHPDTPEPRELPEEQVRWATEMLGRIPF